MATEPSSLFLGVEDLLIERLEARMPDGVQVVRARDLAGVKEAAQFAPAVQVYGGTYTPAADNNNGADQLIRQSWTMVVVVRNARDQKTAEATKREAGALCDEVLKAVLGWRPGKPYMGAFHLTPAPAPIWSPGGCGYYPLGFAIQFTVKGDGN